jgi:hypothetical protein
LLYERIIHAESVGAFHHPQQTNIFQFVYQTNAFLIRQLRTTSDIFATNVPMTGIYAGYFQSNCWAIIGKTLRLFPNGGYLMYQTPTNDGGEMFFARNLFFSTLHFGINFLETNSVIWSDKTNFTAASMLGECLGGTIIASHNGLPTELTWSSDKSPLKTRHLSHNSSAWASSQCRSRLPCFVKSCLPSGIFWHAGV